MNNIVIENKTNRTIDEAKLRETILSAADVFELKNTIIEILIVEKEEIAELNQAHRSIDKPTDVLSFPQIEVAAAKVKILGSIVICPEVVDNKEEDFFEVAKHGLIHLLGYDHETDLHQWELAAKKINCIF
ncbi:MAG: rRNA maturation RNase YbeY [Candidatus Berkelbacteria bacterium]